MADEPLVKVVVDCSVPDRDAVVAYTHDQVEAVLKARVDGRITSEQASESLLALADLAAEAAGIPDRVTIVPLDDDEVAEHEARQAQALEDASTQEKTAADRGALIAKLAAGTASAGEAQQALAQLLGGELTATPEVSAATKKALGAAVDPPPS